MDTIVREEGEVILIGVFYLNTVTIDIFLDLIKKYKNERNLTVSTTSFSVPGTTTTFTLGSSRVDHRVVIFENPLDPGQYTTAELESLCLSLVKFVSTRGRTFMQAAATAQAVTTVITCSLRQYIAQKSKRGHKKKKGKDKDKT